jgi:hypothetical protein
MKAAQTCEAASTLLWTRLRSARCRYTSEHPGAVSVGDLDPDCVLCRAPLGSVTVFRVGRANPPTHDRCRQ